MFDKIFISKFLLFMPMHAHIHNTCNILKTIKFEINTHSQSFIIVQNYQKKIQVLSYPISYLY